MDVPSNLSQLPAELNPDPAEVDHNLQEHNLDMEADPDGLLNQVVHMEPEGVVPGDEQQQEGGEGAHPGQQQGGAHLGQQQEGEGVNPEQLHHQQQEQGVANPGQQQEGEGVNPDHHHQQQQQEEEGVANPGQQQAQNPTPAEEAATLVTLFDAAIQSTREHQLRAAGPAPLSSLKELIFKQLKHGHAAYLHQKEIFSVMPAPLIEEVVEEGGPLWELPRLAGPTIHPHTRRVELSLGCCCSEEQADDELWLWTRQELQQLFTDIAATCKYSLRTLKIWNPSRPCSRHPAPSMEQLDALLRELHGLEKVYLYGEHSPSEVEQLVSSLAASNPGIKVLYVRYLSSSCLRTIWETWPDLEVLNGSVRESLKGDGYKDHVTASELATALQNLRKIKELFVGVCTDVRSEAMMLVARSHPPDSAPYSLTGYFRCSELHSTEDAVQLFRVFPAVYYLYVSKKSEIPLLCAGLERSPDTRITRLDAGRAVETDKLEPLLKLIGQHLKYLDFPYDYIPGYLYVLETHHIDINIIGHYCPQLKSLHAVTKAITSGSRFEVTDKFFGKLKYCSLASTYEADGGIEPPDPMVLRLLSSPHLEEFSASLTISEEMAISLTAASGESRALSSLKRLEINFWDVSTRALAAILSHAPRLTELAFKLNEGVSPDHGRKHAVIESFLQQTDILCQVVFAHYD